GPEQPGPRAVPRLPEGEGRRTKLAGGNLRRAAVARELLALARGPVLYPGRKVSPGDLHGDRCSLASASDRLSDLLDRAELLSVSHQPRCDERDRPDQDGPGGKDDRRGGGAGGESPPRCG